MVRNHGFDDSEHQHVLSQILWTIECRLPELCALVDHKVEQCFELWCLAEAVLDEIFVNWDALNDIYDTLDVEAAAEIIWRDGCIQGRRKRYVNLLDCQMLLH